MNSKEKHSLHNFAALYIPRPFLNGTYWTTKPGVKVFKAKLDSVTWLPKPTSKFRRVWCLTPPPRTRQPVMVIVRYGQIQIYRYNPGELLKEISPYLKRDFGYKRSKF